ncbi:MAG: hypothetical protein HC830_09170 [Bacteroidetes bacterium]|nr:hypothetical protein [Bacteroidales bacterium]NJO69416.1 hypothetical protein [Bacteroidota bacterium]
MKKAFVLFLFIFSILQLYGQEVAINSGNRSGGSSNLTTPEGVLPVIEIHVDWLKTDEVKNIHDDEIEYHDFGVLVAKKMHLLDKTYTYQVAISPGNPSKKTMIRKPVIYHSVIEVEKYLKKLVRKHDLSVAQATQLYNQVLDIALNTYSVKTDQLEQAVLDLKTTEELLSLYTKSVRIIN